MSLIVGGPVESVIPSEAFLSESVIALAISGGNILSCAMCVWLTIISSWSQCFTPKLHCRIKRFQEMDEPLCGIIVVVCLCGVFVVPNFN